MLTHILGAITFALVTPLITYQFFPGTFVKCATRIMAWSAGLRFKTLKVGSTTHTYMEGGNPNGEPVIMIHGFSASKEGWIAMAGKIIASRSYHVFCIDQRGHGDSLPRDTGLNHTPDVYIQHIKEFATAVGLGGPMKRKFHILGLSLGGMVSGLYAATYPEDLLSATLMCPAGVNAPEPTEFQRNIHLDESRRILVPFTRAEFDKRLQFIAHMKLKIPPRIVDFFFTKAAKNGPWFDKLYSDLIAAEVPLEKALPKLAQGKVPVLVIWGDQDLILHFSTAEVFRKNVPGCVVHVFKNCGHVIDMERPGEAVKVFKQFTAGLKK